MSDLTAILAQWPLWGLANSPIQAHQITALNGGLTNNCYHLSLDCGEYVLRINAKNTIDLGINRAREKRIHQLAADNNFTSQLRYCADDHSYWIRDYIVGEVLSDSITEALDLTDSLLAHVIEQLKSLHQLAVDASLPKINIREAAEAYWQIFESKHPNDELLKMKAVMQVIMEEPPEGDFCLCHMDPVLANWLYTPQGLQLLDWEYAGIAHPLWDLAAFWQGIKEQFTIDEDNKTQMLELEKLEEKILTLYGVTDLTAWRRANLQMEYLSSLWYRAQSDG